jgi:LysR family transcriptional regulator, nitrogen assimilation regulatory protein
MELRQLRYFKAIADARSFVRAAGHLCVAQPALSRSMARLEDEIGQTLFVRHSTGVSLTEAGIHLYDHVTSVLRRVQVLKDSMAAEELAPHGVVAFGAPASFNSMVTAPVVAAFMKKFPKSTVNVVQDTSVNLRDGLSSDHLDLAIISTLTASSGLRYSPLLTEGMCLVEKADSALCFGDKVEVADLAGVPLILCGYPHTVRLLLEDVFAKLDVKPWFRCEANTASLVIDLVHKGAGAGIVPSCALAFRNTCDLRITPINGLKHSWAIATSNKRVGSASVTQLSAMVSQHVWELINQHQWQTARFDGLVPTNTMTGSDQPITRNWSELISTQ